MSASLAFLQDLQRILHIFKLILASGGSLECPWGPLGPHLSAGTLPKLDFGSFSEAFWAPFGDPVGIVFWLWAPLGPYREPLKAIRGQFWWLPVLISFWDPKISENPGFLGPANVFET